MVSALKLRKRVVVLKALELAPLHRVLKEERPFIGRNQGLVELRQAKLPSIPCHLFVPLDEAARPAGDGAHLDRLSYQVDACREQKTAIDRRIHMDGPANGVDLQIRPPDLPIEQTG
jgi:hypothetical protein